MNKTTHVWTGMGFADQEKYRMMAGLVLRKQNYFVQSKVFTVVQGRHPGRPGEKTSVIKKMGAGKGRLMLYISLLENTHSDALGRFAWKAAEIVENKKNGRDRKWQKLTWRSTLAASTCESPFGFFSYKNVY